MLNLTQRKVEMFEGIGASVLNPLDSSKLPQDPGIVSKMRMSQQINADADLATANSQFPNEGTIAEPVTLERFMRAVDKAVWENFSRDLKYPLILCGVEHYHPQFHAISKNPYLLKEGIKHDPQQLSPQRLRQEAWAIIEPQFRAEVEKIKNQFMAAKARQCGSDELRSVVEAAAIGRVGTLLVDGGRQIPGRLHQDSGGIAPAAIEDPRADDVLDDLAEMILKADGDVLVLPPDMMPGGAELAAIYRY